MKRILTIASLFLTAFQAVSAQGFFYPDSTFAGDGYAIPQLAGDDRANALAIQATNGKIVVVGQNGTFCLATRFLPDGQIDQSFGTSGYTTFQFKNTPFETEGTVVAMQGDGKIVLGGGTPFDAGLARLLPNGSLDPSFGNAGTLVAEVPNFNVLEMTQGLAIQPDQKILLATTAWPITVGNWITFVLRYLPNGTPDTSFATNGIAMVDLDPSGAEHCVGLVLQADGKILVAGNDFTGVVARLLPNGAADLSFGTSGKFRLPQGEITDISLMNDGKIVVVGHFSGKILLAKLNSNGTFDTTFGAGGMVLTTMPFSSQANGVVVQPADQKIVVTGYESPNKLLCARYHEDGTLDQSFYPGGFYKQALNGADLGLNKVVLEPDGDLVSVGFYENQFGLEDLLVLRLTDGLASPTAAFETSISSGCAPLSVSFNDQSTNSPNAWNWQFPGGTPASSTDPNPSVVYNSPGTYAVNLTVSNPQGTNSISQADVVVVNPPPTATFSSTINGLEVQFTNSSADGTTYHWDFGDGNLSTLQHPAPHIYADSGTYVVTLVATNNCGASIFEQTLMIQLLVSTTAPDELEGFQVYPNPGKGLIYMDFMATEAAELECTILNSTGQLIHAEVLTHLSGFVSHPIDLGEVPPGVYTLRLRDGSRSWMYRVVVR
jgi:uncharacterized delta-60 repeat protein